VDGELPRKTIKEADRRKGGWEQRFGEGVVEIDAIAARQPGRLGQLVRERVESLQDPSASPDEMVVKVYPLKYETTDLCASLE
jgi:hypothetical protein